MRAADALTAVRAAWGATLVLAPGAVLQAVDPAPHRTGQRAVARILGVRHLLQAALVGLARTRAARQAGAAVDGAHVATMLALAAVSRRRRRVALTDAAIATAFTVAGVLTVRDGSGEGAGGPG